MDPRNIITEVYILRMQLGFFEGRGSGAKVVHKLFEWRALFLYIDVPCFYTILRVFSLMCPVLLSIECTISLNKYVMFHCLFILISIKIGTLFSLVFLGHISILIFRTGDGSPPPLPELRTCICSDKLIDLYSFKISYFCSFVPHLNR